MISFSHSLELISCALQVANSEHRVAIFSAALFLCNFHLSASCASYFLETFTECFFLGTEYTDFTEKNKENPRFPCIPCLKKSSSVFLHPLFVFGDSLKIYLFIIFLKSSAICCPILTIALSTLCTSAGVTASL